jgi:hypothetical protein
MVECAKQNCPTESLRVHLVVRNWDLFLRSGAETMWQERYAERATAVRDEKRGLNTLAGAFERVTEFEGVGVGFGVEGVGVK